MIHTFHLVESATGSITQVEARKNGKGWLALCPYHDDHNPSLSIDDKTHVYHCFGCDAKGKIADNHHDKQIPNSKKKVVAEYDYKNEDGTLLYQVIRYEAKSFAFRRMDS